MESEVKIRDRGTAMVLSKRRPVRLPEIGGAISTAFGEVYGYLGTHGVPTSEPPFLIYHGAPGPTGEPFEIEICAPIGQPVDPPAGWQVTQLPAGTFASLVHVGPYDAVSTAYDRLSAWIPAHGYVLAGPPREVYLSEPSTPPEATRTVVEFPIVEVRQPVGSPH